MSELREKGLRNWTDSELASELRFALRFERAGSGEPIGMYERILCEAIARILERLAP